MNDKTNIYGFIEVKELTSIDISTYSDAFKEIKTLINVSTIAKCYASDTFKGHSIIYLSSPTEIILTKESYEELLDKIRESYKK